MDLRRFLAISAALAACDSVAPIDVGDSELLLAAVTNASGDLETTRVVKSTDLPFPLPSEEGGRLFLWGMRRDDVLDRDGVPLDDATIANLVLVPKDEERPGCHRCVIPADAPPKIFFPGESCAPPPARVQRVYQRTSSGVDELTDTSLMSAMSTKLAWQWPGACEYPPVETAPARALDVCPAFPPEGPVQAYVTAMNENGVAIGVNRGFIWLVDGAGNVRWTHTRPGHFGDVRAAAALPGSAGFIYAADDHPNFFHGSSYYVVSESLEITPISNDVIRQLSVTDITVDPFARAVYFFGRYFASGMGLPDEHAIMRCELGDGAVLGSCAREYTTGCDLDGMTILPLPNGTTLGVARTHFMYRPQSEGRWYCDESTANGRFTDAAGNLGSRLTFAAELGAIGDRMFACFRARVGDVERPIVMTADIPELPIGGPATGAITYRVALDQNPYFPDNVGQCDTFITLPELPDRLLAIFAGYGAAAFDATGTVREKFGPVLREVQPDGTLGNELVPDLPSLYGRAVSYPAYLGYFSGAYFYRRDGRGPFLLRYGARDSRGQNFALIGDAPGGGIYAFRSGFPPLSIDVLGTAPRCEDSVVQDVDLPEWTVIRASGETVTSTVYAAAGASYSAIAKDSRSPGTFVLLGTKFGIGFPFPPSPSNVVHRVDVERREVRETLLGEQTEYYFAISELGPGRFLVLGSKLHLLELDTGEISDVEVVDRDPLVAGGDPEPSSPSFNAIDAEGGIGWAAGSAVLARIVPKTGGGLRAETYWGKRVTTENTPSFTALEVRAPDELLLGGRARSNTPLRSIITLWRATAESAECPAVRGGIGMCVHPDYLSDSPTAPDLQTDGVRRVFDRRGVLTAFFSSEIIYQNSAERIAAPFQGAEGLVERDRWFAFGNYGYLGIAVERE